MTSDDLASRIQERLARSAPDDGPGAAVGVQRGGRRLFTGAVGSARIEPAEPFGPDTLTPIASLTKSMTALCALRLADAGRLDLDAPIGDLVEGLAPAVARPTLRQLMSHASGLRCHLDLELFSGYEATRPDGFGLATLRAITDVNAEPGAWRVYGNSGFHLLGHAIAAVAGAPLGEVMRREIFGPLGMDRTFLAPGAGVEILRLCAAYSGGAGQWRDRHPPRAETLGEGGVVSTLDDLMRWTRALREEDPAIPATVWQAMKKPLLSAFDYWAGLASRPWRGTRLVGHGGSLIGISAAFAIAPEFDLDVVMLANFDAPGESLARDILAMAIGEESLAPPPPPPRADHHRSLVGRQFVDDALIVGFGERDGNLTLSFQGLDGVPLEAEASEFVFQGSVGPVRVLIPAKDAQAIVIKQGNETRRLARAETAGPHPAVAPGNYANAELGASLTVWREGEETRVTTRGPYGEATGRLEPLAAGVDRAWVGMAMFLLRVRSPHEASVETTRTRRLPFLRQPEVESDR